MNMHMTVAKKIALTCALLVAASLVQVGLALRTLSGIRATVATMNKQAVGGMATSAKILQEFTTLSYNHLRHVIEQDPAKMEMIQRSFEADTVQLRDEIRQAGESAITDEDRRDYASLAREFDDHIQRWLPAQELSRSNKTEEAMKLYVSSVTPSVVQFHEQATQLNARKMKEQRDLSGGIDTNAAESYRQLYALSVGATLCGILAAFFIVRGINLALRNTVVELDRTSRDIASASEELAQGATEQAATIEETSSASTEINSMAQRNTENSRHTNELVAGSQSKFEETNRSLGEMVDAMNGITSSSQKISKIIKVIDEIAFQTNILALNAAVEAARAGEAGMGFAVVADEVRNLAQRSAQAAKDTAALIEESIERSQGGKQKVDLVAASIHSVTAESAKIKMLVEEINLGSAEQSRGIDQISRSIGDMEQVTQSGAASAQQLSNNAETMREVVASLTRMVGGIDSNAAHSGSGVDRRSKAVQAIKTSLRSGLGKGHHAAGSSRLASAGSLPMDDDFKAF